MFRFLGKILILIPFFYMIYGIVSTKSYPENLFDVYFFGFIGLVGLGLVAILLNINKILGIIYVLLGFGVYCYFYDQNIFNLWPIGGLFLLIDPIFVKSSAIVEKKVEDKIEKVEKVEKKVEKKVEEVSKEKRSLRGFNNIWNSHYKKEKKVVSKPVVPDYWVRYDRDQWKKKSLLNKLQIKFNEILLGNKK